MPRCCIVVFLAYPFLIISVAPENPGAALADLDGTNVYHYSF